MTTNSTQTPARGHVMTITPNQLKLFWMAARRMKLNDEAVRVAVVQIPGVCSVKELD